MAARDDTYRNQRRLDMVFALSCLAMLASIIWMFERDHNREYKVVQRQGRDIEVALLRRQADKEASEVQKELDPLETQVNQLEEAAKPKNNPTIREAQAKIDDLTPARVELEAKFAAQKAVRDSLISEFDEMVHRRPELAGRAKEANEAAIQQKEQAIKAQIQKLDKMESDLQNLQKQVADHQRQIDKEKEELTKATAKRAQLKREQDRLRRLAEQKEFGLGAKVRGWPILDAFNSPYKVEQYSPEGLTDLDYNFKRVQRVDRCATCHMFIERDGYEKSKLADLAKPLENYPNAATLALDATEIAVYSSHPRLDLFVGANSPHSAEKFGCTVCHSGQGGSATFNYGYHFPDAGKTGGQKLESYGEKRQRWTDQHHWHENLHPDFLWDFPMYPKRFIESTCLKCHHQVTDLIRTDGREEAPKLLKGYRLLRDNGCFGCHEVSGFKGGRSVGPDLRLEPYPSLDELSPLERSKVQIDANEPPGTLRKVGPGLRRIAEKTNADWMRKWIRSPSSFRPDTKMPHFFGLTNNHPHQLSDVQAGDSQLPDVQKDLPTAEIEAVTFYLQKESENYLDRLKGVQNLSASQWEAEQQAREAFVRIDAARKDNPQLVHKEIDPSIPTNALPNTLATVAPAQREKLTKDQLASVLTYLAERDRLRHAAMTLDKKPYPSEELKDHKTDAERGGQLFQTRGCLACHSHEAVKVYNAEGDQISDANYGPNLSSIKDKLGNDKVKAEKWLYYWLTNPSDYHPRAHMPNPQLQPGDRADIAAWLLSDKGYAPPPDDWKKHDLKVGAGAIEKLALTYLEKNLMKDQAKLAVTEGLPEVKRADADEAVLAKTQPEGSPVAKLGQEERVKYYVGRKTIGKYGCFACHDIPGFETAKPIGTPLNDWGRKDAERLAFNNIVSYVESHYPANGHGHSNGHTQADPDSVGIGLEEMRVYDPFFIDALHGHRRDGFLYQKLKEPRSYDFDKYIDKYDDRLKMPQFKFAHPKKRQNESDEDFAKRAVREEDEAVEAVMTFVLGLVAEPMPMKFVYQPPADRLNEIKGVKLLEKFNCIACHIVKPGGYEFALSDSIREGETMHQELQAAYNSRQDELARDHFFAEHSAWNNQRPYPSGRVVARGIPAILAAIDEENRNVVILDLWEALRFPDQQTKEPRQFPAGSRLQVPAQASGQQHAPTGGAFAETLTRILAQQKGKNVFTDRGLLLGSVPPPLIREGQRVQAQWLLEFLRHPHEIRPPVGTHLRMPEFNMSHEDAQALVQYFIAVDRLQNPAVGVEYFSPQPTQREAAAQQASRADYDESIKRYASRANGKADYFEAGWRLLTDPNLCLKCHDIGTFKAQGDPKQPEDRGPPLHLSADRLRPDFVERWISFPPRIVPYTLMPQYDPFFKQGPVYQRYEDELQKPAVKTMVQLAPLLSPPLGRNIQWPVGDRAYNQLQREFALTPLGKIRAVRDAIMSWGYLADPPPTAKRAGPKNGNMHSGAHHP